MSVKHVNEYYAKICEQYREMIRDIQDVEREAEQGMVEPERLERLKEQIAPIKLNYERWSYMMFLLHQPNRKDKIKKYKREKTNMVKCLSTSNSLEAVIQENDEAIKHIGE